MNLEDIMREVEASPKYALYYAYSNGVIWQVDMENTQLVNDAMKYYCDWKLGLPLAEQKPNTRKLVTNMLLIEHWKIKPYKEGDKCIFEDCDGDYVAVALKDNEGDYPTNCTGSWDVLYKLN